MPTVVKTLSNGGIDLRGGLGPQLVSGAEAAQSKLSSRFNSPAGAWVFNLEWGPAYNAAIFGKFFDNFAAASLLASEAGAPRGIAPVAPDAVSFVFESSRRELSATISPVYTTEGESFDLVVPIVVS